MADTAVPCCSDAVGLELLQQALMQHLSMRARETAKLFFKGPAFFLKDMMQGMMYCGRCVPP